MYLKLTNRHTHRHNHFTALLDFVQDCPGEPVSSHFAESQFAESQIAESHFAESQIAESHFAEMGNCVGTLLILFSVTL